jgi:uncharacterized small protein (DUF1192 family)
MLFFIEALNSLRPSSAWTIIGDDAYTNLNWLDESQTKPTEAELLAEVARLKAEYDAKQYQRDRAKEYPTLQEQLDMQYWDSVNGTTVWQDTIEAIKAKYPKGV